MRIKNCIEIVQNYSYMYIILIRFKLNMKAWHEMYLLVRDIAVDSFRVGAVPGGDVVVS